MILRLPRAHRAGETRPSGLGLAPILAISLALVVLLVSLGRLAVLTYLDARATAASQAQRLSRGMATTTAFLGDERRQTILGAEAAGAQPGLADAAAAADAARPLPLVQVARKAAGSSLVGVVDADGKVLAADPATNLALGTAAPVRQALGGRDASGWLDDSGTLDFLAAAPLRSGGRVVGATVALQRLDDALLASAVREIGVQAAVLSQGRVLAATGAIRTRANQERNQPAVLRPGNAGAPGTLTIGGATFVAQAQELLSLGPGREVTLVVGQPVPEDGLPALVSRANPDLAASGLAALLAGAAGWLIGAALGRSLDRLASTDEPPGALAGAEAAALAAWLREERAAAAAREAAARDEAGQLRAVLDAIGEGIIVSDGDRRVVATNAAARALLGLSGGRNGAGGDGSAVVALLPPAEGTSEFRANARVLRSYAAPLVGADGSLGRVTVLHDATAERESERLRGEFLSVVSHELQTPLTAIVGAADLLLDEPAGLSPEQARFLGTIRRNGDRLIALVSDLLDVSRLEAGRVELDRQPVDLGALARATLRSMANLFDQKGQVVVADLDEPVPPVLGDRRRLEQILANLLANAGQYTQPRGQITVRTRPGPEGVVLSVADNGPGISPAEQERIFDKFYRGSGAGARRERGSGLGLAIARSLVELHGGRIWLESAPGRGTTFSVSLPAATAEDE